MIYRTSLFAINFISPFNASFRIAFTKSCASIAMIFFSFLYSYSYLISLILIFPHRVFTYASSYLKTISESESLGSSSSIFSSVVIVVPFEFIMFLSISSKGMCVALIQDDSLLRLIQSRICLYFDTLNFSVSE